LSVARKASAAVTQYASVTNHSFCHSLQFGRLVALFLQSSLTQYRRLRLHCIHVLRHQHGVNDEEDQLLNAGCTREPKSAIYCSLAVVEELETIRIEMVLLYKEKCYIFYAARWQHHHASWRQ